MTPLCTVTGCRRRCATPEVRAAQLTDPHGLPVAHEPRCLPHALAAVCDQLTALSHYQNQLYRLTEGES